MEDEIADQIKARNAIEEAREREPKMETGTEFLLSTYEGQDAPEDYSIMVYSLAAVVKALDKVYGNGLWRSGFLEVQVATFESIQPESEYIMSEGVL